MKKIYVRDLFENLHQLMQPTFEQKNIELEIVLRDTELHLKQTKPDRAGIDKSGCKCY